MNNLSRSLAVIFCLFSYTGIVAQTKAPVENFKLILKHTGTTYTNTPNKEVEDDDLMYVVATFQVNDWSKVSRFYLKLGTKQDAVKKAQLVIDVKNPKAGLPADADYWTQDNTVYIRLVAQKEMKKYSATLVAEDADGNKTAPLKSEKE